MPNPSQHLLQFEHNNNTLSLLCRISPFDSWDWKITICFYAALHLIHTHLAESNSHPTTHNELKKIINPFSSSDKLKKISFASWENYSALENRSRKSRYLLNFKIIGGSEKEFRKALKNYNTILVEFNKIYPGKIKKFEIILDAAIAFPLDFITIKSSTSD